MSDPLIDPKAEGDPTPPKEDSASGDYSSARWTALFAVSVVILVLFGVLMIYMMAVANDASNSDAIWTRQTVVFGAGQAIAFTAVGWLFGREVNRTAAENSEAHAAGAAEEAKQAKKEAKQATAEARTHEVDATRATEKARALAAAITTSAAAARQSRSTDPALENSSVLTVNRSQLESLQALARELFPELGPE